MTRMSKSAGAAAGFFQILDFDHFHLRHGGDHHLGNPHGPMNLHRMLAMIDQRYGNFTAVIGIDGAG